MSGAAYAQGVTLSGSAEMGIADGGAGDAMFHQDIDVTFKMESMTDAGLTFGTAIDIDEVDTANAADEANTNNATGATGQHGGVAIYVNGPFGNVTLGDTDGGFDWAMSEVGGAGAITDDHTAHAGFDGNSGLDGKGGDGQILAYNNSFGDLGVAISFEQEDGGMDGDVIGVGVTGGFGDVGLGVGFQTHDNASIAGASVTASFGDISGALNYSRLSHDADGDTTHLGAGATYTMGATTVNVNFGQKDNPGDNDDQAGFGVAAQYDLGGGAKIQFGYGNSDYDDDSKDADTWSLGLSMGF